MKFLKYFLVLFMFLNSSNIYTSQLTPEIISKKPIPNLDSVKEFFENNKLFNVYIINLHKKQKNLLGHQDDLIQELFEGLAALKQHASNNDQASIDLVGNTLSTLFGSSWQAYYN